MIRKSIGLKKFMETTKNLLVDNASMMMSKKIDHMASLMAEEVDKEIMKLMDNSSFQTTSTSPEKPDPPLTTKDLKKTVDMASAPQFIPKIWSEKLLSKFYDEMVLPRITGIPRLDPIRALTEEIRKLSESGLTPEQIAEKIDPDDFFDETEPKLYPWKTWQVGKTDKITINNLKTFGIKVLKPKAMGGLGFTS